MATPSAIFGGSAPAQPVHILVLIENCPQVRDHWQYLRQRTLPRLLGAIRLANCDSEIRIFWKTTGATSTNVDNTPKYCRQFNDMPDIDIINHRNNKLTPFFVQQSVEMFVAGDYNQQGVSRHLILIAASSVPSSPSAYPGGVQWESIPQKLVNYGIVLHVVANPKADLGPILDVYRRTITSQSRVEAIPWLPSNATHFICRLSQPWYGNASEVEEDIGWPNQLQPEERFDTAYTPSRPDTFVSTTKPDIAKPKTLKTGPATVHAGHITNDGTVIPSMVSQLQTIYGVGKKRDDGFDAPISPVDAIRSSSAAGRRPRHSSLSMKAPPLPRQKRRSTGKRRMTTEHLVDYSPTPGPSFTSTMTPGGSVSSPDSEGSGSSPSAPSPWYSRRSLTSSPVSSTLPQYVPTSYTQPSYGYVPVDSYGNQTESKPEPMTPLYQTQLQYPTSPICETPAQTPLSVASTTSPLSTGPAYHYSDSYQSSPGAATPVYSSTHTYSQHVVPSPSPSVLTSWSSGSTTSSRVSNGSAPFIFDPEYEAQTARRFQETLHRLHYGQAQSSVYQSPPTPSGSGYYSQYDTYA